MKTLKARLTFTEELLGSANNNPDIHEDFIASKSDDTKKTAAMLARKTEALIRSFFHDMYFAIRRKRK